MIKDFALPTQQEIDDYWIVQFRIIGEWAFKLDTTLQQRIETLSRYEHMIANGVFFYLEIREAYLRCIREEYNRVSIAQQLRERI